MIIRTIKFEFALIIETSEVEIHIRIKMHRSRWSDSWRVMNFILVFPK